MAKYVRLPGTSAAAFAKALRENPDVIPLLDELLSMDEEELDRLDALEESAEGGSDEAPDADPTRPPET